VKTKVLKGSFKIKDKVGDGHKEIDTEYSEEYFNGNDENYKIGMKNFN